MLTEVNVNRLALSFLPRIGPKSVLRSFEQAHTVEEVRQFAKTALSRPLDDEYPQALERAWNTLNEAMEHSVTIVAFDDERFPEPLRRIPNPPPFLHVRGTLPQTWDHAVAIIGTRKPSPAAIDATQAVVANLADANADSIVVSGLALGIDVTAHNAALRRGLRTIAILANGLDEVYPKAHKDVAAEIVGSGGALISEWPVGTRVIPYNLVARDRLQSGTSVATFLMQSNVDGGSMHTAHFCLEQRRMLVALRALSDDPGWSGNQFLTRSTESIDWSEMPQGLERFHKYASDRKRLAFSLAVPQIADFVRLGVQANFRPRTQAIESLEGHPSLGFNL